MKRGLYFRHAGLWLGFLLMILGSIGLFWPGGLYAEQSENPTRSGAQSLVYLMTLDDAIISPITAEYLQQGIDEATSAGAEAVVIKMDTPGGLLNSTHTIVRNILNAPLPIIVYVAPAGARAGSAGTFITLSAHVAAMEPSTRIGAAHPVDAGGNWPGAADEGEDEGSDSQEDKGKPQDKNVMSQKIMNDTVASMRVIAQKHGRNEEWAVRAVTESASITAEEALENNVVDVLASSLDSLLEKTHGRTVQVQDRPYTLDLENPRIEHYDFSIRQQIISTLTHPMLSYLLLMIGFYAIMFEVTNPGLGVSGFIGLVCVVLALIGMQALAINYAGLGLIVLGLLLFGMEFFTPTFGALMAGGVICVVLGSLFIYQTGEPFLQELIPYIVLSAVLMATLGVIAMRFILKVYRNEPLGAEDKVVGQLGKVSEEITPDKRGRVRVYGELWSARADESIEVGTEIRVKGMHPQDTKVLIVERFVESSEKE